MFAIILGVALALYQNGYLGQKKSNLSKSTSTQRQPANEQINQQSGSFSTSDFIYPNDKHTPLMLACDTANVEQVKVLLSKNVSIEAKNKSGITALMLAAKANYMNYGKIQPSVEAYRQVVALLLQRGADVKDVDNIGNSVLTYAALGGNVQVAKLLIDKGASTDATNSHGISMLHAAAISGNLDMMKLFIDKGADINAANDRGETPLWIATPWTESLQAFKLLVDKGADIKVSNADGETLLMAICGSSESDNPTRLIQESKASLLIEKGIDIDAQSDLSLAAKSFNSQLGGFGVDRSMATSGKTALMFAVREHDPEMIKLLLVHGANVNLADEKGQTALMHACLAGMQDNAILLLKNKADPNSADSMGTTAVMIATKADNLELCEALFDKGADPNFRDDDGKRAADYVVPDGKIWKAMGLKPSSSNIGDNPDGTTTPPVNDGNDKTTK